VNMHRNKYFVPASSLSLLVAAFRLDEGGVHWLWSDQPLAALLIGLTAAVFWVLLWRSTPQRRD
jgi:hypothetical protein